VLSFFIVWFYSFSIINEIRKPTLVVEGILESDRDVSKM
ncbi:hypothetical protein LCGC14_2398250, partial [marine sediment metagenome]